jgi:molecular chaperone HtpG
MTLHYKAEGRQSYAVLLFAPSARPFDLGDPERKAQVKLYVRRVYITDDAALLPSYLRFMRGVVDSEDMPLNISREMLQNNPHVEHIRQALTSRVITELQNLADKEAEKFGKVWEAFGRVIKEGIYEDHERRDKLLALARFTTTQGLEPRTLKQYVADFRPNQTEIYYLVGDSAVQLGSNPKLEAARARGVEVLLLTDPVDALWTSMPQDFEGKPLKSLSQGEIDFGLVPVLDQAASPEAEQKSAGLDEPGVLAAVKDALGERVSDVRVSLRLTDSPACLVAGAGFDRELSRLLARQNRSVGAKPVLELNLRHPIVKALSRAKTDARDDEVADLSALLFEQAKILDGEVPDDPAAFAKRVNRLVMRGLPASE